MSGFNTYPPRVPAVALVAFLAIVPAGRASDAPSPAITRHEVRVHLDVPAHRLEATDVVRLESSPEESTPWRFLLHEALVIEEVRDREGKALKWDASDGWDPRHFWKRPPYGELGAFEIAREVSVQPPPGGWGEDAPQILVSYSGVIADSLHSPERAYGRSFQTTRGRIVEQGAYLHGETFWVPWSGEDLFQYHLAVDGPPDWRVISQGRLAKDEITSQKRRLTAWDAGESTESIYLIAGPYEIREKMHAMGERSVTLLAYCYANTGTEIADRYLEATGPYLDHFSELFGDYPYAKFALVENYWQTGYGMPSFTFLGDRVIRLPFILHTSYPHEILHNWWGNGVYVSWEAGNWSEGLTTYCADYLAKEKQGENPARDYRRDALLGYRDFAASGGKDFALVQFRERDSASTQAVGYGKTLMVFHMLRRRLGDAVFFGALRRFYEDRQFQRADWDDVQRSFERESGSELAAWFDQWIRRPGAVDLSLADVAHRISPGESLVRGVLQQGESVFDVQVPIVVEGSRGETARTTIHSNKSHVEFEIDVAFSPTVVRADPGFDLFRLLHSEEVAPALSGVLGAERVRVVLGEKVSGEIREAMRSVAEEWAGDSTVVFLDERDAPVSKGFAGGTWFFGEGVAADDFFSQNLPGSEVPEGGGTLVAAGRLDGDPHRPAALFLPESADVVPAIARKIPHYSKYSYLLFDGERNVGKGSWSAGLSPLTVQLKGS